MRRALLALVVSGCALLAASTAPAHRAVDHRRRSSTSS